MYTVYTIKYTQYNFLASIIYTVYTIKYTEYNFLLIKVSEIF